MKFFFALLIGLGIGYFVGFSDARKHDRNIIQRSVDRTGAKSSERNQARDAGLDSLSKP